MIFAAEVLLHEQHVYLSRSYLTDFQKKNADFFELIPQEE